MRPVSVLQSSGPVPLLAGVPSGTPPDDYPAPGIAVGASLAGAGQVPSDGAVPPVLLPLTPSGTGATASGSA